MDKTNAMRILDRKKIPYQAFEYDPELTDGQSVAAELGLEPNTVFKTLVTCAGGASYFVFVVPVISTLDLKKAAKAAGVKSLSMLKQKDLFPLTGYVHGGCSPLGMKKALRTFIHASALGMSQICVSAGRRGMQIRVEPSALAEAAGASFADLTADEVQ